MFFSISVTYSLDVETIVESDGSAVGMMPIYLATDVFTVHWTTYLTEKNMLHTETEDDWPLQWALRQVSHAGCVYKLIC